MNFISRYRQKLHHVALHITRDGTHAGELADSLFAELYGVKLRDGVRNSKLSSYTGRGSLIWLQDLDAWAAVIARLLSPSGRFVLFEGHPVEWLFDADEHGRWIATDYDYFSGAEASRGWAPEYIDHLSIDETDLSWKFARAWTLGEVITALLGAELRLETVAEHPIDWWGGHADVREDERGRIPLSFSVTGRTGR